MIRSLIIDDEPNNRSALKNLIHEYCPNVDILKELDNIEDAEKAIHTLKPDLLFLDVEMPYGSGFDLLKKFPNPDFWVIFVTGFGHYAIQAFRFCALDYLLKPVNYEELKEAVGKLEEQKNLHKVKLSQLQNNLTSNDLKNQKISIPSLQGIEFVKIGEVIKCEADGSYTHIHLKNGKSIYATKNLGYFKDLLPSKPEKGNPCFFRVHYTYLINLKYVDKFKKRESVVKMEDKSLIPVAQRRKADFTELLRQYL